MYKLLDFRNCSETKIVARCADCHLRLESKSESKYEIWGRNSTDAKLALKTKIPTTLLTSPVTKIWNTKYLQKKSRGHSGWPRISVSKIFLYWTGT